MTVFELVLAMAIALIVALGVCRLAVYLGFPVTPKNDRLGNLDGLRGFVAFAVVFHHFVRWVNIVDLGAPWMPPKTILFDNLGKGGVAIFFMITGAVFYPRVIAGIDHVNWKKLYISRVFRIIPLSLIVTAIAAIVSLRLADSADLSPIRACGNILSWVTGLQEKPLFGYQYSLRLNAGVMWSLWYEWIFYLALLPAMAALSMLLRGLKIPLIAGPMILLSAPIMARVAGVHKDDLIFVILFALGMIAAELCRLPVVRKYLSPYVASIFVLIILFVGMAMIAKQYSPPILLIYFILILAVSSGNGMFGALSSDAARTLGDVSFGIYMLHGFVLSATIPVLASNGQIAPLIALPIVAALTVLLSIASYLLIERPMIKMGQRAAGTRGGDRSLAIEIAP